MPEEPGVCLPEGECTVGFCVEDDCLVDSGEFSSCAAHLACISSGDVATCKQVCTSNDECSNGQECYLDFFMDGSGICAFLHGPGESCTDEPWTETDTFCHDNDVEESTTAGLLCFDGSCQYYCDYTGNEEGPLQCPSNSVCSDELQYFETYQTEVGLCVFDDAE